MIERYTRPEMGALWTDRTKLDTWTEVEALALEAWEKLGTVPAGTADAVRSAPAVDIESWRAREAVLHHDLAAFVDVLASSMAVGAQYLHYGLTSSDVLDTAQGATLARAGTLLLAGLRGLFSTVRDKAFEHRDTVMVGRTHGIWAEPTTFGLKLASWAFELARDIERLEAAVNRVAVGTISGAVGNYAHIPDSVEAHVCTRLGIGIEPAPSQVTARDRHAEFLTTLAIVGATIERMAVEIRHLHRSEVGEVQEPFRAGQKGSSAMPHKRNPVAAENLTGIARLLRGYAVAGLENVALWHERDISHSSVERVVLPDACVLLDYALHRMTGLIEGLVVNADRMRQNLAATRGLVYSQRVLLELIEHQGLDRDTAYRIVQRAASKVWEEGGELVDALAAEPEITLDATTLATCFDPSSFVSGGAVVFERLAALRD